MSSNASTPAPFSGEPLVVIEAKPEGTLARLKSLWQYRGFYGFLFKEMMTRRGRGTVLGIWWVILRPLLPAAVLIFTFNSVAPVETPNNVPYPVFFMSGYVTWQLFQRAITFLPRSLTWTQSIMRRTYFPRLLVPLAGFAPAIVEFVVLSVTFVVVVVLTARQTGQIPVRIGFEMLWIIPALIASLMFALAIGIPAAVAALFFRDVRFLMRYFASLFMFVTPVVYPLTFIPERYRWAVYVLNPMAEVIELSRWALLGVGEFRPGLILLSFAMIGVFFALGVAFFLRAESHLGDQL